MTREELKNLRNENRDKFVQTCHNVARVFGEFADLIKEGGLLTESNWKSLNEAEFVYIHRPDEDVSYLPISYLFSDSIDTDTDIVKDE